MSATSKNRTILLSLFVAPVRVYLYITLNVTKSKSGYFIRANLLLSIDSGVWKPSCLEMPKRGIELHEATLRSEFRLFDGDFPHQGRVKLALLIGCFIAKRGGLLHTRKQRCVKTENKPSNERYSTEREFRSRCRVKELTLRGKDSSNFVTHS